MKTVNEVKSPSKVENGPDLKISPPSKNLAMQENSDFPLNSQANVVEMEKQKKTVPACSQLQNITGQVTWQFLTEEMF